MEKDTIEVSVVIPTLNEEKTIGRCIEKIKKVFEEHNIKGEIIVADNSTDRTPEIARSLGAKVVTPDRRGYGYAYIYGFRYARGKYIVMADGDDTYDFLEMPKLLEPLMKGEADLVIGSRLKGKILPGAMPKLHQYIGNPLLTWILNLFFKVGVSDAHCGFRAFTREALKKMNLRCPGMEFASEMLIEAKRKGLRIKEVPITYYPREGESKLRSFSDGWRHLKFMLIQAPDWLYFVPSGIFLIIGALLLTLGFLKVNIGVVPGTYSMVAGSLLVLLSYQIASFGIFTKLYGVKNGYFKDGRITKWIKEHLTLERGVLIGVVLFMLGLIYVLYLLNIYLSKGYAKLPFRGEYMVGLTLIVAGLQTVFSSFIVSTLIEGEC
ncbi:glycosyltransferase family 2 protein [Pyrococcus kukulkanii]|uniref:glycosyltransferase family 2 protein n=1 Tax=Pyrococcus kukulkanii TaxID=1609559 RepID=UPI00356910C9